MPVVGSSEVDNYKFQSDFNYLSLKDDGDIVKVRFYIESIDDLKFYVVHQITNKAGKTRYVDCLRTYDAPIDDCPFCVEALKNKDFNTTVKMFIPVYDMDDKQVKLFERGKSFKGELEGHIRRNAPLVSFPCEIERCGKAGDKKTVYKVYPLASEKDDTLIKDLPEQPELLGGYVLQLTIEEMRTFLETGELPQQEENEKEDENLPRRTSRTEEKTEQTQTTRRRTASRF